jgi:hypothetical protein
VTLDQVRAFQQRQREWVQRFAGEGSAALPVSSSIEERLQRARAARQQLEELRRERAAQPLDLAEWTADDEGTVPASPTAGEDGAGPTLMDTMEQTISAHRAVAERVRRLDEARTSLRELRAKVAAIQPPKIQLSDRLTTPGQPAETSGWQELARASGEVDAARNELVASLDREAAALAAVAAGLTDRRGVLAGRERVLREKVVRWLELALAGSVGYWTAISLLVGWSMHRDAAARA